jgi:ABC-2 type transport system ATP-binding protein
MPDPILEVLDVTKRYGPTVALDGVSFQVAEGEMFGLLGPNGAGKTTLLSIVSCLLFPTSGEVRIAGRTVRPADLDLRRTIGIVPQELAVYGQLTGRENLRFFGELYGLAGVDLARRVDEVLRAVALTDRADARVDTYSGGMKRRLNLGAALLHRPRLLLLDEPTVGVDPQSRHHIFEEVRRLNAAGVTVVYTSHYMEEVQALCRRVGIIDHGRLIACDTLPNLLRQLEGLIRFRVTEMTPALRERIKGLPDAHLLDRAGAGAELANGQVVEVECRDVKGTLLQLVGILNDLRAETMGLETEEPNLERVFLHLTGRGLRD